MAKLHYIWILTVEIYMHPQVKLTLSIYSSLAWSSLVAGWLVLMEREGN